MMLQMKWRLSSGSAAPRGRHAARQPKAKTFKPTDKAAAADARAPLPPWLQTDEAYRHIAALQTGALTAGDEAVGATMTLLAAAEYAHPDQRQSPGDESPESPCSPRRAEASQLAGNARAAPSADAWEAPEDGAVAALLSLRAPAAPTPSMKRLDEASRGICKGNAATGAAKGKARQSTQVATFKWKPLKQRGEYGRPLTSLKAATCSPTTSAEHGTENLTESM
jgi:hypothetical protein